MYLLEVRDEDGELIGHEVGDGAHRKVFVPLHPSDRDDDEAKTAADEEVTDDGFDYRMAGPRQADGPSGPD